MIDTQKQASSTLTYDDIAQKFTLEAQSLIPEALLQQTLQEEKVRFENAALLGIPTQKLVGNNTLRYCKDLLRKRQPFSFLYFFLNFITEISILMLFYGCIMSCINYFIYKQVFLSDFPFLTALILTVCALCLSHHRTHLWQKGLLTPTKDITQEKEAFFSKLKNRQNLLFLPYLFLMGIFAGLSIYFKLDTLSQTSLFYCFMAYIICILLSGVHNTLYGSHFISFFAIGGLLLSKRSPVEVEAFTNQYLHLSYIQLLGSFHKTLTEFQKDSSLKTKIQAELRARLNTHRVYYALAFFILVLLDCICVYQLTQTFTLTLLVFLLVSLLATAIFVTVLVSANHILRLLPKLN